ncbi:FliO/MopB family protein [Minwuia sp.]|uniref:FliO/MopB family protein n=1 Tax=Minwuia sp. TaxID=2493630 RepID=UPI003A91C349
METFEYLRFLAALVLVVGLIAGAAWAARRFGLAPRVTSSGSGRLAVVSVQAIDTRRKLVLVRRDDREHLIIVSPTAETVIETGIQAVETAQ